MNDPTDNHISTLGADEDAGAKERRQCRRLPLKLNVAVIYHRHLDAASRPTYHGVSSDISLCGLSVVVPYNVFTDDEVTVLIAIPPEHPNSPQRIVEATAQMVYTVFSSDHDAFRIGMSFCGFKRNGKELLRKALSRFPLQQGRRSDC